MGWKSFLGGVAVGVIGAYYGSETVQERVTDSWQKSEQLINNNEAIDNECYNRIAKWYHNGELGAVVTIIQQQQQARAAGLNMQAQAPGQQFQAPPIYKR